MHLFCQKMNITIQSCSLVLKHLAIETKTLKDVKMLQITLPLTDFFKLNTLNCPWSDKILLLTSMLFWLNEVTEKRRWGKSNFNF